MKNLDELRKLRDETRKVLDLRGGKQDFSFRDEAPVFEETFEIPDRLLKQRQD